MGQTTLSIDVLFTTCFGVAVVLVFMTRSWLLHKNLEPDENNAVMNQEIDDQAEGDLPVPVRNQSIVDEISQIITDRFKELPTSVYDHEIERACGLLGDALAVQHVAIWKPEELDNSRQFTIGYGWNAPGVEPIPDDCRSLDLEEFAMLNHRHSAEEAVLIPDIEHDISHAMHAERSFLEKIGCSGMAIFPLGNGDEPRWMVSYLSVGKPIELTEVFVHDVNQATESLSTLLDLRRDASESEDC